MVYLNIRILICSVKLNQIDKATLQHRNSELILVVSGVDPAKTWSG